MTVSYNGLGTVKVDDASAFAGALTNISSGDAIELTGLQATSATLSGTTLSVTVIGSATPLTFKVEGAGGAVLDQSDTFAITSDASGDSYLTLAEARSEQAVPAVLTALGEPGNLLKLADTHVGVENLDALSIENAATSPADGLGASVVATSGDAVAGAGAIVALAPGSIDNTSITVGLNDSRAGAETGVATLGFTTDGSQSGEPSSLPVEFVEVSGDVYRLATAGFSATAPIVHVGSTGQFALTLTNPDPATGLGEFVGERPRRQRQSDRWFGQRRSRRRRQRQ